MKLLQALVAAAQLGAVLAAPRQRLQARDYCEMADNCEVWYDESGIPYTRFKPNMGPGSAWYNETIAPHVRARHSGPMEGHVARQINESGECKGTGRCTVAAMSQSQEYIGVPHPADMAKELFGECTKLGCHDQSLERNTRKANTYPKIKLKLDAAFEGSSADEFKNGMIALASAHVTKVEQFVPALGHRAGSSYMGMVGPKTIHLNRFSYMQHTKSWTLEGFAAMTYSLESTGKETCEKIMDILGLASAKLPPAEYLSLLCMAL